VAADGLTASPGSFTFNANLLGMSGTVTWSSTGGMSLSVSGNTATLNFSSFSAVSGTITATITVDGQSYAATATVSRVADGAAGNDGLKTGVARLYQWASAAPAAPAGTSTFTWASVSNGGYTGADGWSAIVPTNPGTPGLRLYVASMPVSAAAAAITSPVSYVNATVEAWSQNGGNGANGLQSATATVYQWAATIPSGPIGAASYTWATRAFGAAPSGWSLTPGTSPSAGMTLWAAAVQITDSAGNSSTAFNWSSAAITATGYAGTNGGPGQQGASYVTAYCASTTGSATSAPAQTTGKTSLPAANSGGIAGTWSASVPTLSAGQYMYQSDGIYDPATGLVTWSTPYWSSLKVASLSAITLGVMGAITSGSMDIGSGATSWHVDASGNQWSGATNYAAAPFRVDNAGNVLMKSFVLQDANGNTILQAGGKLPLSYVPSGALNSELTPSISAAATTAVWSSVSGAGKPQDNATVGANAGNFTGTLGGDNLMRNSSFEVQTTSPANKPNGYAAYNNAGISTSYLSVAGRTGGKAFAIRANATGATQWGLTSSNGIVENGVSGGVTGGWQPNKIYMLTFKAKKVNGTNMGTTTLQWNTAPISAVAVLNPPLTTSWQSYAFRITWGASVEPAGQLYIDARYNGSIAVNDEFHVDELLVQEGDVYSEWFPSSAEAKAAADIIAINPNGSLTGGSGGQVTLPGMGQNTYRVITCGNSIGVALPAASGFYINGVLQSGSNIARSYTVIVLNRSTGAMVSATCYDVYGTGQTNGLTAANMASDLNALGPDKVVVVVSWDEPQANRFDSGLGAAMYRCGASKAVFGSSQFQYRSAYVLVGIPGCGEGNGAEAYQGSVSADPNAWVDVSFSLLNGSLVGVTANYTPRTLQDYGYSGDLNATVGAPTGTMVGGTDAGLVASRALNGDSAYSAVNDGTTGLAQRLRANAANVLSGSAGLAAGTLTWDGSGDRAGGYGVAMNQKGIVAYNSSGNPTFTLDATNGNATFYGSLSGATGTFAGSLSAATGSFAGSLSAVTGNFYTLTISSGGYLRSSNFSSGSAGFSFNADGSAELGVLSIRGAPTGPVSNTFNPCTTTETTLVTLGSGAGLTGAHKVVVTITGEIHSQSGAAGVCNMTLYRGTAAGSENTAVTTWTAYASTSNGTTFNSTTTYVNATYEFNVAADSSRTGSGVYFKVTAYVGSNGNVTSSSYATVTISTNVKSSTL
jgi:hypothetical protein